MLSQPRKLPATREFAGRPRLTARQPPPMGNYVFNASKAVAIVGVDPDHRTSPKPEAASRAYGCDRATQRSLAGDSEATASSPTDRALRMRLAVRHGGSPSLGSGAITALGGESGSPDHHPRDRCGLVKQYIAKKLFGQANLKGPERSGIGRLR